MVTCAQNLGYNNEICTRVYFLVLVSRFKHKGYKMHVPQFAQVKVFRIITRYSSSIEWYLLKSSLLESPNFPHCLYILLSVPFCMFPCRYNNIRLEPTQILFRGPQSGYLLLRQEYGATILISFMIIILQLVSQKTLLP